MMTRKDFQALAQALKDQAPMQEWIKSPQDNPPFIAAQAQWTLDCRAVADVCGKMNPAFDRSRFLRACGLEG